jgi:hypothetical protein
MTTEMLEPGSLHIRPEKFLAFVSEIIGARVGREDDEHPLKPGPWGPVIRAAVERTYMRGPGPEPWSIFPAPRGALHSEFGQSSEFYWRVFLTSLFERYPALYDLIPRAGQKFGETVSLNPQPLPPRLAFLQAVVHSVIDRAELFQDIADATANEGERRGIIIVGGYISRFCDELCGTNFRLIWPFPGPPPVWFTHELHGDELVVMAAHFHEAAKATYSPELRQHLADAGARFASAGIAKMH